MYTDVVIRETERSKPKVIGRFNRDKNVFETVRDYEKHLLRKKNAWALDYKLVKELLLPSNSLIVIIDNKRSTVYKTTAKDLMEKGEEIEYLQHRKQICMNLNHFSKERI